MRKRSYKDKKSLIYVIKSFVTLSNLVTLCLGSIDIIPILLYGTGIDLICSFPLDWTHC